MKHKISDILEVGSKLFRKKGYTATGTDEILKLGQYPRSSFYYHFNNKEGFAIKVLEKYGDDSSFYYSSVLSNKDLGNADQRLLILVDQLATDVQTNNFTKECLIQKFSSECAGQNETLKIIIMAQLNKLLVVLSDCIFEGQNQGIFNKNRDSFDLARRFQALLYGSFIQARLQGDSEIMRGILHDEIRKMKN